MDDYPSNSRKFESDDDISPKKVNPEIVDRKVERVTTGGVTRKKKSVGKRLKETFIGGDARSTLSFVVLETLIPAAKDMIVDAGSQFIERTMYGEVRGGNRRRRGNADNGHVNYGGMYTRPASVTPWSMGREQQRPISHRGRATHNFDEIILETRAEAQEVIDQLFEIVSNYDQVTVSDLYESVGITPAYTDKRWGWTDIRGAGATKVRGGYLLQLPRPEPLD